MRRLTLLVSVATLVAALVPALAASLDEARRAILADDTPKALRVLQPLVDKGDADAELLLADIYARGTGIKGDPVKATALLNRAAEHGSVFAKARLSIAYEHGDGVPLDPVRAYMWIYLAAQADGRFNGERDRLRARMTPAEIAAAQRLALEWAASR